jgi:hypothetical protein
MSRSREGLDALLAAYPEAEVAHISNQLAEVVDAFTADMADRISIDWVHLPGEHGPWTCVDLYADGRILRFAIWNETGNVYCVDGLGAVEDDPSIVLTPPGE